jgi:hypothetical protein
VLEPYWNGYLLHRIIDSFTQLFRMKKYTNKTSFVGPEVPKARAKKFYINIMNFILVIVEKCL